LEIFDSPADIYRLNPNYELISKLDCRGIIVTAPGQEVDFVSRFFAPRVGINEDPVTGSTHTSLTPFWAQKLQKKELTARQISARGGELKCNYQKNKVILGGQARTYLTGQINIE
jgi:predicted PhzF superfamily epimerase YddE/YHI9